MNPLVSIVAPVYKVEPYLSQCIESVINQSYGNWELILVDDGSPDHCGSICDEWAAKDTRIKVIHQQNGGLSAARNTGIEASVGHYLFFLDSDDYIKSEALKTLIVCAKSHNWPEYVKGNHEVLRPDGECVLTRFTSLRSKLENTLYDSSKFLSDIILPHPLVWNGLIARKLVKNHRFDKNGWPREDLLFHLDLISERFTGVYTGKPTYVYRLANIGSLSNTLSIRSIHNIPSILKHINFVYDSISDIKLKEIIDQEQVQTIKSVLKILPRLPKEERLSIYHKISDIIHTNSIYYTGGGVY